MTHEPATQPQAEEPTGYTPAYSRDRRTRRSVLIIDRLADSLITVGGLMVIFAVFGIMVFLAEVVVPLFTGGKIESEVHYKMEPMPDTAWVAVDEYNTLGLRTDVRGRVETFHIQTGTVLETRELDFDGHHATAVAGTEKRDEVAFGFEDGSVRFGRLALKTRVLTPEMLPAVDLRPLNDQDRTDGRAVYTAITGNQFREVTLEAELDEPTRVADPGVAIVAINYRLGGTVERPTRSFVTIDAAGVGRLSRAETRINLMTRKATTQVSTSVLPPLPDGTEVKSVLLTGHADQVYVAERSGVLHRFDTRDFAKPVLAETLRVTPEGVELGLMEFLIGEHSLVVGGSDGSLNIFFRLQPEGARGSDGYQMIPTRFLEPHAAPLVGFGPSQRRKSMVTIDAAGHVWFRHATSEQVLLRMEAGTDGAGKRFALVSPREEGIMVLGEDGNVHAWRIKAPHPETTLATIFGKAWYEGYPEPTHTWQSSSGTDLFEPKLSLIPLIFGTLKATVYAMLFAVPVAMLGAIYTSEFVHRKVRATVKPVMEMMESLPTVVLGFIAALILAPIVESWIGAVMLAFIVFPLSLMLAAYLWQCLPHDLALKLQGATKFFLMIGVVLASFFVAYKLGDEFERLLFYGDIKAWANGDVGVGTPFMFLVLLPLCFMVVLYAFNRSIGPWLRGKMREMDRQMAGVVDGGRWLVMLGLAGLLSFATAWVLTQLGFDPRGGVVDTYVQRNALVVGFVMGFAVIPNIYTLAEDALNAVPSSLRAASLAAGATPWQTAIWVILPTAMSGVFAAVMIGMGRAVGETMIVVMAAGNTPVLDWNIFNGLRTLSANIAVELPEAVKDGTLYRTLFLAALTLFIMTFCINTVAEVIRQRFRKRAFQL